MLAEGDSEGCGLCVADLLVAALVDLLEEVAARLVQRCHVPPFTRETLDVHRVGEVSQVHTVSSRLPQVV